MFEHGRSLVKQYQDAPFAFVGVCCTDNVGLGQQIQTQYELNWRSFNDAAARIEMGYGLLGYPTFVVIDHQGKIQWIGHQINDALVAKLVAAIA
jgi:hypothetical protein